MEALHRQRCSRISQPAVNVTSELAAATVATIGQSPQVDAEAEVIRFPS